MLAALDAADADLDAVTSALDTAKAVLAVGRAAAADAAAAARGAADGLASVSRRRGLVATFLAQYQLTAAEADALAAGPADGGGAFYAALDRARTIHANCRALLRSSAAHSRPGLALADAMAARVEAAHERLCRWVAAECRGGGGAAAARGAAPGPALRAAFAALAPRPSLLKYCIDEVVAARGGGLYHSFVGTASSLDARGSGARDAGRYVADLCAAAHGGAAGEVDALTSLLVGEEEEEEEGGEDTARATATAAARAAAAASTEGLARPLATRLESVLLSSPAAPVLLRVTGTLAFYSATLGRLLGEKAALACAAADGAASAGAAAAAAVTARRDALARAPPRPAPDMVPGRGLLDAAAELAGLCDAAADAVDRASAAAASTDGAFAPPSFPHPALAAALHALDTALAGFAPAAAAGAAPLTRGSAAAGATARANGASALAAALRACRGSLAADAVAAAEKDAAAAADEAAAAAAGEMLDATRVAEDGGLARLATAAASPDALATLQALTDAQLRASAITTAAEAVCGAYAARWAAATAGGAPSPPGARPPTDVRVLLGLAPK